jgi:hypothetical protein
MNGTHDPNQPYPQPGPQTSGAVPPPYPPQAQPAPPAWRQNFMEVGIPPALANDPRRKSLGLAAILSAMPGLGQVYVGYYHQGFINILVVGTVIVLLNINGHALRGLEPLLGLFLAFFWLYNMVDAYRRASFYNHSLAGVGAGDIPDTMKLPKAHGSLGGGIALIVVGLLLFANTALGMSLDWLEQWWPMGLVLGGAYLVYMNAAAKKNAGASGNR